MPSRRNQWDYDGRGRVTSAALQVEAVEGLAETVVYTPSPADRIDERTVVPASLPGTEAPPSWTVTDASDAHQILELVEGDEATPTTRAFTWTGGRRTSDGVTTAVWDIRGRLIVAETLSRGQRVRYTWTAGDRLVGRVLERLTDAGTWVTEIRPERLGGLPAEASFVWDYATDRLVAIYDSAAVRSGSPDALMRQYVHGDAAYDDPVEITIRRGADIERYYPILDEAGAGSLEAVVDSSGALVERMVHGDAYGDDPRYLHGAVLERITRIDASLPRITLHFTDAIAQENAGENITVIARTLLGARETLAVDAPTVTGREITIALPFDAWEMVESSYAGLEITIGSGMRFEGWGDRPAHGYRSPDLAASAANIAISIPLSTGPPSAELFVVRSLHKIASTDSLTDLHLGLHAAPFADPATRYHYFRARWYDPRVGTFLSPDPEGYEDSSNLYATLGGDPVNFRDPRGRARRTKNGGVNHLGDISNELSGDTWWSRGIGIVADTVGNTVSDVLMLDAWADANVVAWDSSRSGGERATAAAKGIGVAALNLVGGEIVGTAGKALLKIPGARNLVARVSNTKLVQVLTTDVGHLVSKRPTQAGVGDADILLKELGSSPSPPAAQPVPASVPPPTAIDFSSELGVSAEAARRHLRRAIGPGSGQAHHIVPWELRSNPLIESASRGGFNINGSENGIRLLSPQHLGSHRRYTAAVQKQLDRISARHPNLTDLEAAEVVRVYVEQLRRGLTRSSARLR